MGGHTPAFMGWLFLTFFHSAAKNHCSVFFSACIQRIGGMFLLPISKHFPVKLHESLLDAETLKPALLRQ
jgi:hypothetical protein